MIIPINLSIWFWIYNYDIMKRHWLPGKIQLTPSPINPELHTHANSPIVLVQAALAWQLWVPVVHSSMSEYIKKQWIIYISIYMSFYVSMFICLPILGAYDYFLPAQDVPEPLKPDLQAHVKPPFVLVQSALGWQLWILAVHSFTSGDIQNVLE